MAKRKLASVDPIPEDAAFTATAVTPQPQGLQTHVWHTQEEYDAQLALPQHYLTYETVTIEDGVPGYTTPCGVRVGSVLMRGTGDPKAVTCPKCKRKLAKK